MAKFEVLKLERKLIAAAAADDELGSLACTSARPPSRPSACMSACLLVPPMSASYDQLSTRLAGEHMPTRRALSSVRVEEWSRSLT